MSFVLYVLVLIASVSSVLLGLDWLASPPQAWRPVQVASQQQPAKPVKSAETKSATTKKKSEVRMAATQDAKTDTKSDAKSDAKSGSSKADAIATAEAQAAGGPTTTGTNPAPSDNLDTAGAPGDRGTSPLTAAAASAVPACDVRACERAYYSFRQSDCTYQPYDGPRRFCDKGTPPAASTAQTTLGTMTSARAQASSCNVQACAAAYQSFSPADCTYQPYDGPRQLCTK
jgi:hypothetical protein